jgi:hypothetical protein
MVEEERFSDRLQHVDGVVVAADVRELMREDRLDLGRRQRRKRRKRQDDDRTEASDDGWHVDRRRLDDMRRCRQAKSVGYSPAR